MTWVAAGVASAAATAAGVKYIKGRRDAKKDAKNRPVYEIPDEIKQNLSQAQLDALTGLPEEQYQRYVQNIQQGSASALQNLSSRKAGIAGVAGVNQQQNEAMGNLLTADVQERERKKALLSGARLDMADYKQQQFQLNKLNPYYEKIAQRQKNDQELFQGISNSMGVFMGGQGGGMMGGKGGQSGGGNMSTPNYGSGGYNYQGDQFNTSSGSYS